MIVEQVMSRDPISVKITDTVRHAVAQLTDAGIRHLPVVEGGRVVGILSDRDIRNVMPLNTLHPGQSEEARAAMDRSVESLMSCDVVCVTPQTALTEVIELLLPARVSALPVLDADTGELVGMVSYLDVLRAARDIL
jgi:CBS domain-containing protein